MEGDGWRGARRRAWEAGQGGAQSVHSACVGSQCKWQRQCAHAATVLGHTYLSLFVTRVSGDALNCRPVRERRDGRLRVGGGGEQHQGCERPHRLHPAALRTRLRFGVARQRPGRSPAHDKQVAGGRLERLDRSFADLFGLDMLEKLTGEPCRRFACQVRAAGSVRALWGLRCALRPDNAAEVSAGERWLG